MRGKWSDPSLFRFDKEPFQVPEGMPIKMEKRLEEFSEKNTVLAEMLKNLKGTKNIYICCMNDDYTQQQNNVTYVGCNFCSYTFFRILYEVPSSFSAFSFVTFR